ncbi:MAG: hypothetical protein JXR72_07880 [Proteobacteria bacterium]|nr:hypothetical protein [Pseudomonadota bacterium]
MPAGHDLAIISTRFPLLALGVLLAKKGRRVLIVDSLPKIPGPEEGEARGYCFRRRPVPLFGLDDNGILRKLLDEVGIGRILIHKTYTRNKVSYQVVLPGNRISVFPARDKLILELAREFPDKIDTLRDIYSRWDTIADRWNASQNDLARMEKGYFNLPGMTGLFRDYIRALKVKDPTVALEPGPEKDFFDVQNSLLGAGWQKSSLPSLSQALIHNIGKRGTFRDPGGTDALRNLFIQRFQEYGGKLIENAGITGFERNPQGGLELHLGDGTKVKTLYMATTEGISSGIPGLPPRRNEDSSRDRPLCYPLRFFIGMDERYVPVGMADDVLIMPEKGLGPLSRRSLYLALNPSGSKDTPKGKRALTVTALVTDKELASFSPKAASGVREDLLQTLEGVIPFLSEGMDFLLTDANTGKGSTIPRPVGGPLNSWSPGILGKAAIRTVLKGKALLFSPAPWELGLEGEALAAISAARLLQRKLAREG